MNQRYIQHQQQSPFRFQKLPSVLIAYICSFLHPKYQLLCLSRINHFLYSIITSTYNSISVCIIPSKHSLRHELITKKSKSHILLNISSLPFISLAPKCIKQLILYYDNTNDERFVVSIINFMTSVSTISNIVIDTYTYEAEALISRVVNDAILTKHKYCQVTYKGLFSGNILNTLINIQHLIIKLHIKNIGYFVLYDNDHNNNNQFRQLHQLLSVCHSLQQLKISLIDHFVGNNHFRYLKYLPQIRSLIHFLLTKSELRKEQLIIYTDSLDNDEDFYHVYKEIISECVMEKVNYNCRFRSLTFNKKFYSVSIHPSKNPNNIAKRTNKKQQYRININHAFCEIHRFSSLSEITAISEYLLKHCITLRSISFCVELSDNASIKSMASFLQSLRAHFPTCHINLTNLRINETLLYTVEHFVLIAMQTCTQLRLQSLSMVIFASISDKILCSSLRTLYMTIETPIDFRAHFLNVLSPLTFLESLTVIFETHLVYGNIHYEEQNLRQIVCNVNSDTVEDILINEKILNFITISTSHFLYEMLLSFSVELVEYRGPFTVFSYIPISEITFNINTDPYSCIRVCDRLKKQIQTRSV